jgi:hypothetical protein
LHAFACNDVTTTAQLTTQCPTGEVVVGGSVNYDQSQYYSGPNGIYQLLNFPSSSGDGWTAEPIIENDSPCDEMFCYSATVYAICMPGSATVEANLSPSPEEKSASSPKTK